MHTLDHTENIIEVKGVSFSYSGERILDNISFNLHRGDFLGVIGPNGSGKTTLFKVILGILKPSSGSVSIFGRDLSVFKDWKKIGYVAQKATNFDPKFPVTVREVVAMGRYAQVGLFRFLGKHDWRTVDTALKHVGMFDHRNLSVGDLSGGQQQRGFIARALASEPEIVLLDEPTVGVDQKTQGEFYTLLKKLNDELKLTLVLISHDISVVAKEVTEIAYINRRLVYYGEPKEFLKEISGDKYCGKGVKLIHHHA